MCILYVYIHLIHVYDTTKEDYITQLVTAI